MYLIIVLTQIKRFIKHIFAPSKPLLYFFSKPSPQKSSTNPKIFHPILPLPINQQLKLK